MLDIPDSKEKLSRIPDSGLPLMGRIRKGLAQTVFIDTNTSFHSKESSHLNLVILLQLQARMRLLLLSVYVRNSNGLAGYLD